MAEVKSVMMGEPIAFDERGVPTIVRQVDQGTGQARTIVRNQDGSQKAFGGSTVASLVGSPDGDAKKWLENLRDQELRGLVHELGKRLVDASRLHTMRRSELEGMAQQANFAYFGLSAGADEKELHAAYRRMAKRMHPDKNGGTEEAKRRFQQMKERYERLKERYRERDRGPEEAEPESSPSAAADAGPSESDEGRRESDGAEDEEEWDEEAEEEEEAESDEATPAGEASEEAHGQGPEERADAEDPSGTPSKSPQSGASSRSRRRRRGSPTKGGRSPNAGNPPRREAYDEDEESSSQRRKRGAGADQEQSRSIQYDPTDRSSMDSTVWRMREQMARLQGSLQEMEAQLRHVWGR